METILTHGNSHNNVHVSMRKRRRSLEGGGGLISIKSNGVFFFRSIEGGPDSGRLNLGEKQRG